MPSRRPQQRQIEASIAPEVAYRAIKKQLASLQDMWGKNYREFQQAEQEWVHLTNSIFERAFGNPSSNLTKLLRAKSAGDYYMTPFGYEGGTNHALNQSNFETRIRALESVLKACIAELEIIAPQDEVTGAYEPGEQYEFYRDVKSILANAKARILIVDPYLSREIFDIYADGIDRNTEFRILTTNLPADALAVAQKYAAGHNLALRTTNGIHDRVIFAGDRVWMVGQSLKDAAKMKPTYIIEHDEPLVRPVYEDIWKNAQAVI